MRQIAQTSANPAARIDREDVPTVFVYAQLVPAVGQVFRLERAICKINLAAKALHLSEEFVVAGAIDLNISELPGHRQPAWGKNYKTSTGMRKHHLPCLLRSRATRMYHLLQCRLWPVS